MKNPSDTALCGAKALVSQLEQAVAASADHAKAVEWLEEAATDCDTLLNQIRHAAATHRGADIDEARAAGIKCRCGRLPDYRHWDGWICNACFSK